MIDVDLDRPWVPPSVRALRAGDRVRVRLSLECRFVGDYGHRVADGYEGTVLSVMAPSLIRLIEDVSVRLGETPLLDPTHNITVQLESRNWFGLGEAYAAAFSFAPIELELLDGGS